MKKSDIFNTFNYIGILLLAGVISGYWVVDGTFMSKFMLGFLIFMIVFAMYINYQLNNPTEMDDDTKQGN